MYANMALLDCSLYDAMSNDLYKPPTPFGVVTNNATTEKEVAMPTLSTTILNFLNTKGKKTMAQKNMTTSNSPAIIEKEYLAETTTYIANNPTDDGKVREELSCRYSRLFQALCESCDNSSSNFRANDIKNGIIDIAITNNDYHTITVDVYDNGTGIKNFDAAISLGNTSGRETEANSHSFGLKDRKSVV